MAFTSSRYPGLHPRRIADPPCAPSASSSSSASPVSWLLLLSFMSSATCLFIALPLPSSFDSAPPSSLLSLLARPPSSFFVVVDATVVSGCSRGGLLGREAPACSASTAPCRRTWASAWACARACAWPSSPCRRSLHSSFCRLPVLAVCCCGFFSRGRQATTLGRGSAFQQRLLREFVAMVVGGRGLALVRVFGLGRRLRRPGWGLGAAGFVGVAGADGRGAAGVATGRQGGQGCCPARRPVVGHSLGRRGRCGRGTCVRRSGRLRRRLRAGFDAGFDPISGETRITVGDDGAGSAISVASVGVGTDHELRRAIAAAPPAMTERDRECNAPTRFARHPPPSLPKSLQRTYRQGNRKLKGNMLGSFEV